ncbi:MAG: N-acetylmuramoyl-L-alanine amidase [Candidatus Bipolaricaulota bacterium]|nr:N-acetylmuramoyl-L-alanine amidase [Candidatus Bipolaricaulota bacterium]
MNKRGYIAIAVIVLLAAAAVAYFGFLRQPAGPSASTKGKILVALDAGHGGKDPGATSGDYTEKVINFAIVKKIQSLFASDSQIRTITTRSVDVFVPLEERIRIAQDGGASIYVSVHVNSFTQSDVSGVETWVDTTRKDSDPSWTLAAMLQDALSLSTGARNRGIRTQESYLQRTSMPAVTVEVGYITNPAERTQLLDGLYQDKIAAGVVTGIRQFLAWRAANPPASSATPATTSAPSKTTTPATSTTKTTPTSAKPKP